VQFEPGYESFRGDFQEFLRFLIWINFVVAVRNGKVLERDPDSLHEWTEAATEEGDIRLDIGSFERVASTVDTVFLNPSKVT